MALELGLTHKMGLTHTDAENAFRLPIDGARRTVRAQARWPAGLDRFAERKGSKPPVWTLKAVKAALRDGASRQGAPEGWGWLWEPNVADDAVSNLLPSADPALWGELVWALGAHTQALGPILRAARAEEAKRAGTRGPRPPQEWPDGRKSFALDGEDRAELDRLDEGWLLKRWVDRFAIAQQGDKLDWAKTEREARECLDIWKAAGGGFSRQLSKFGMGEMSEGYIKLRAMSRKSHLALAMDEPTFGALKALALIEAGASLDEEADHCAVCWLACAACRPDAAPLFEKAKEMGADLNAETIAGISPLLSAAMRKNEPVFSWLAQELFGGKGAVSLAQAMAQAEAAHKKYASQPFGPENADWLRSLLARAEAQELAARSGAGGSRGDGLDVDAQAPSARRL